MTTDDDMIAKADVVCGIAAQVRNWFGPPAADIYRRGAYSEWLGTHPTKDGFLTVANSVAELASEVVRIHEEAEVAKRLKCPDDGLPPGPWEPEVVDAREGRVLPARPQTFPVAYVYRGDHEPITAHIARCGSPAVRRLLHAFDVTDEKQPIGTFSNALCVTPNGNVYVTTAPSDGVVIVCWLTPREAKR